MDGRDGQTSGGVVDAWTAANGSREDELTYSSNQPFERIDYVWFSSDLRASTFSATTSTASDHRGVTATLSRG